MAKYTQDNRPLSINTPFGKDALLLETVKGKEGVSQLFLYQAEMLSAQTDLDPAKILGQKATITLETDSGKRYFNGLVNHFVQKGQTESIQTKEKLTRYYLEMVPELWLGTRKAQSRIFQQMSVPDILKKVLADLSPSCKFQGTYNTRDYCVQYRETDFAFVCRLMEEEGIYYFFQHEDGKHQLVLSDNSQGYADVPGTKKVSLFRVDAGKKNIDQIMDWQQGGAIRTNKFTLWDYCFEMPDKNLEATTSVSGAGKPLEVYDFPGGFAKRYDGVAPGGSDRAADVQKIFADSTRTVDLRKDEAVADTYLIDGTGNCRQFVTGHKFTLAEHFNAKSNIDYVLTRLELEAKLTGAYLSSDGGKFEFANRFHAVPASVVFRPLRLTPRPIIAGPQTALVVGPAGQEIFTDKYGRVKVQFPWDREGKKDANSSCWVRVGTGWAGQQWGMIHIPRIGHEVIVVFEEGDPDQPIVVGNVYNSKNMPPYKLPDNMTQSGIKSRSTLKGTGDNFNELRFEDKKGSEQVYFHAEKNFDRVVENNDTLKVGSDKADDGSQTIEIWKDRTETVKTGNETITIEKGNRTETIKKGDEKVTLETGSRTHAIKKDDTLTVEGKRTLTVTGDQSLTVKSGNRTVAVSAGADSVEAAKSITLKVGGCSIEIKPDGITIKAPKITIQADATAEVKSPATTVSGDGTLVLKGGTVAIN